MKRLAVSLTLVLAVGGLVAFALARPDLMPSWAYLGRQNSAQADALQCKEHGVPEKFCTLCHKELKSSLMLCKEHGNIPEDICTLCHPEVKEKYGIEMCPNGHGLPKHFCFKCGTTPSTSADDDSLPDVKLASPELARDVGIETAKVATERHAHTLKANAETAYDAGRVAEVRPRVGGFLREVRADLGEAVRKEQVLAVVDSAEVGAQKARYLSARAAVELAQATYERTKDLASTRSVAAKQELEARAALSESQAALMEAEQRLRNFRFDDEALARIAKVRDTASLLEISSPIGGTVVMREGVGGEAVEPTRKLFVVADTSKMWLWLDVYESGIEDIRTGQAVSFSISGTKESQASRFTGKVTWVGTEVNPTTRTIRVRAELENPSGRLRAHQFGRAEIQLGPDHETVVVPREAVQRRYQDHLVFVALGDTTYRPERVRVRPTGRGDVLEVASGLKPGVRVVTTGSFLLKTETMKDALGAGCTDD
ncbi:MAG: efflux RND transporter periplasmic adaptor subunit [Isosphaeraceae bacterium]